MLTIKKIITLILIPGFSIAQTSLGIKAGVGLSKIKSDLTNDVSLTWQAGVYSIGDISDKVIMLIEADYTHKNSTFSLNDDVNKIELGYAGIRFMPGLKFYKDFYVGAGPYISYLVYKNMEPNDYISKSYFSNFAAGLNPTLGYENKSINLILRYDWGLTLITMDALPEVAGNPLSDSKFRGFELIAGYTF